jgi:hypothetical protein
MSDKKDNSQHNPDNQPVIENDTIPQAAYVSQKCSRLASALYAVTRFLADNEPLKTKVRNLALSLVESARNPGANTSSNGGIYNILTQLRDQLTIARDGGLISSMNHHILTEEIDNLLNRLREEDLSFGPHVNADYLDIKDRLSAGTHTRKETATGSSNSVDTADNQQESKQTSAKPKSAKQQRREKILGLFAEADEITVNDVTEVINGYSTKTIQRDLKALVESGKLEKHGKRRWTSYTRA